jgi:Tol biopolymer transport system component
MLRGLIWITGLMGVAILTIMGVIAGTRADHLEGAWIVGDDYSPLPKPGIFRRRFDGRVIQQITDDIGFNHQSAVSPDGAWIGFMSDSGGGYGLNLMRGDGRDLHRVTGFEMYVSSFAWSPDSQWIALEAVATSTGQGDLYVIHPDGSGLAQLTDDRPWDGLPYWSEDGQWILFLSYRDVEGSSSTYRIRPDGSGLERQPDSRTLHNDQALHRLPGDFPFHPLLPTGIALALLGGAIRLLTRRTFSARSAPH